MPAMQAIRGMKDILPNEIALWQRLEAQCQQLLANYGYQEIRCPIVEKTELFKRTIGDVTDIVEKEMYTFCDRDGDSLSLRPEGTAQCVRALINHHLSYSDNPRLWYYGPMFRHERPQKGRYRQFYQLGAEAFGSHDPAIDVEQIALVYRLWQAFDLTDMVTLQINSLGTFTERQAYKAKLIAYFEPHLSQLDAESQQRLYTNPLRILDSKNPALQSLIAQAPQLLDSLNEDSWAQFKQVQSFLTHLDIPYRINPRLVRGLDYYCHTVYEWVTTELGAQGTICAGGRYNDLVSWLGGPATPAVGFAIGIERLLALIQLQSPVISSPVELFMVFMGDKAYAQRLLLTERIRALLPQRKILMPSVAAKPKNLFKQADKYGAKIAVIIGEQELANDQVSLKYMQTDTPQCTVDWSQLPTLLNQF
jgi:histidyl-tRNA synthetase